jgi:hypothetical protein
VGAIIGLAKPTDVETNWLAVPVVGPWLTLRTVSSAKDINPGNALGSTAFLIFDGAAQAAGLVLTVVALSIPPGPRLVRNRPAVIVRPLLMGSGSGLSVRGSF